MRKSTVMNFVLETMPELGTPGDRFSRSDPTDYKSGTPRPFIPQFRFHGPYPSKYITTVKPARSPVTKESSVPFKTPNLTE